MAAIDTIISVNVSLIQAPPSIASFSIPLIMGPTMTSWSTTDYVHPYTDPADMLTDGYTTTSPEYKYALKLVSQNQEPSEFLVGYRAAAVAQVDTFAIGTLVSSHDYQMDLNGVVLSYTASGGDTQQSILGQLLTQALAISPAVVSGAVVGTGSGALLTLTSLVAGQSVAYTAIDSDITHVALTANYGIADDLNSIILKNNSFYAVIMCSNVDSDILQLAAAIEPLKKICLVASGDSAIGTNASTDILSVLKGLGYNRTALMYSPTSYNLGIEAAWGGGQLPSVPGSNNWAYATLVGIAADPSTALSDSARLLVVGNPVAQVTGKNGNVYTVLGGQSVVQFGQMVSGRFIDIQIGIDWLEANIQSEILASLVQAAQANKKIPYTDKGTAVFKQDVKSVISTGETNGLVDPDSPVSVTAPAVASVPASQRAGRLAPPISFVCTLQGAMNAATINGTVLV